MQTAIQAAFEKAGFKVSPQVNRKPKPMWNASLSFRTYNQLKAQGVMA
jgi:hypothetical protein